MPSYVVIYPNVKHFSVTNYCGSLKVFPPSAESFPGKSLNDIQNIEDIKGLSVKELKCILSANFVDFKGCCEKDELLQRVRNLWKSKQGYDKKSKWFACLGRQQTLVLPGLKNLWSISLVVQHHPSLCGLEPLCHGGALINIKVVLPLLNPPKRS